MIDFPNGTGNRINVATPAGLDTIEGTDTCSWMTWFRYDSRNNGYNSIMSRQVISSGPWYENVGFWLTNAGAVGGGITVGGGNEIGDQAGSTSSGTLYFLACVYDNNASPSRLKVYLDGSEITTSNSQSGTIYGTDKSFSIGANCNNYDGTTFEEWFDGQIGPLFVSSLALSLSALEAVRLGRGAVLPPGLVFGAHLLDAGEGSTPTLLSTLTGETFSITGSPTGYGSPHALPSLMAC